MQFDRTGSKLKYKSVKVIGPAIFGADMCREVSMFCRYFYLRAEKGGFGGLSLLFAQNKKSISDKTYANARE